MKVKTNKMCRKKFRITASGRIKRRQANRNHNTAKKTSKRKRRLRTMTEVSAVDRVLVIKQMPNG